MLRLVLFFPVFALTVPLRAQGDDLFAPGEDHRPASHGALRLTAGGFGLTIGNSRYADGLRINFRDHEAIRVRGINLTLWSPKDRPLERLEGLGVGVAPAGSHLAGISIGIAASVWER